MDYLRLYGALIAKAQARGNVVGYKETHHIVPRSFGGSNDPSNLVALTAREHFVAHRFLAKIYPNTGMVHAIYKMACSGKTTNKYIFTSRLYEHLRKEHARRVSEDEVANAKKGRPGRKQSEEHIRNRVKSRQKNGPWLTDEARANISKSLSGTTNARKGKALSTVAEIEGHKRSVETRKKNGGYIVREETREAMRRAHLGKPGIPCSEHRKEELRLEKSKTITCPHCGAIGQCMVMHRWHFDNCKKKVD